MDAKQSSSEEDREAATEQAILKLLQQWKKPEGYNKFQILIAAVRRAHVVDINCDATKYDEAMKARFGLQWKRLEVVANPRVKGQRTPVEHTLTGKLRPSASRACSISGSKKVAKKRTVH